MRRLLSLLRSGKGLRHAPVVHDEVSKLRLRVLLCGLPGGPIDVSEDHCPVSLRPLVLGVTGSFLVQRSLRLEICVADEEAAPLARLALKPMGTVPLGQRALHLFGVERTINRCLPPAALALRYLLAWQNARTAARRHDALCMSAADLRALNAYYIVARPVFLVGVGHGDQRNIFPMDLVARLSSGEQVLALRATSPSVALMEASRRIVMSSAPAQSLEAVYALGRQHQQASLDLASLPLQLSRSPLFGLPALNPPQLVRELSVEQVERIGSHVLFVCRVVHETGRAEQQLAHVSGMYVEWLRRHRHGCGVLAPL